ncbi:MAG: hypothetical protein ACRDWB_08590, partial [Acidimicrobiales bacterium]
MPAPTWKLALSRTLMSALHAATRRQDRKLPAYPLPTNDPFYASHEDLAEIKPGTLLDWRPIPVRGTRLKVAADSWQIRFRSTDTGGESISSVATLMVPQTPWPGGGPRPL